LFESVVTGAADGYFRMTGKPASTLLHLGPGLANGLANLHNAKKASSGIVNIVGEHASYHITHNAPLTAEPNFDEETFILAGAQTHENAFSYSKRLGEMLRIQVFSLQKT
jgi:thiamine pyrophosphate-dependent acetolactate synthase large subunit-like protein